MKKRFLVLAMALCMVFALGFAFAETAETPAEKTYDQAAHDTVCVAEGIEELEDLQECTNPDHTYDPTCTEKGATCYLCPLCKKCIEKVEVKELGHNWVDVEKLDPTCVKDGYEAYAYCDRECCLDKDGKATVFAQKDKDGKYVEIKAIPVIAKLNHIKDGELYLIPAREDWQEYVATLPCGQKVSLDAICGYKDKCGAEEPLIGEIDIELSHEWEAVKEVPANCTETGVAAHEVCVREVNGAECGAIQFNGKVYENLEKALAADKKLTLAKLGHNLVAVNGTPGKCEENATSDHMACDRKGCDYTEGLLELPAPGHEFTEFIPEVPATCTTKGLAAAWKCSVCGQLAANTVVEGKNVPGDKIDARAEIPALNHVKDGKEAWKTILGTPATCETDGVAAHRVCTLCGKIEYNGSEYAQKIGQELVIIPAHGHVDEDGFVPNTANSPERKGDKSLLWTQADMIKAGKITLGKNEKAEKPDTDPTCEGEGYICTKYCPWCYEVRVNPSVIPANGHKWELEQKGTMPGCETTGLSDLWKCSVCGKTEGNEVIAPLGHAYTPVEGLEPTCTEGGWYAFEYCTRCKQGTVSTIDPGMMLDTEITFTVTFDAKGKLIIPDEVKVEPYWHLFEEGEDFDPETSVSPCVVTVEAVKPTCTENGILGDGRWCELCKTYVVIPTVDPALGHNWAAVVPEKAATCLDAGYKAHQACDREGCLAYREVDKDGKPVNDKVYTGTLDADKKEVLPAELVLAALGHKEIDGIAIDPTCTEKGKTAGTYCERCGMAMKGQEEVPALGHDWTVIAKKEPWCATTGTKEYHLCNRCDVVEVVEDNGKVAFTSTYTVVKGSVILNDETKAALVIPALGHVYNDYVAKLEPTCWEDGHEEGLRCSRCTPEYADGKNDAWLIYPSVIETTGHPEDKLVKVEGNLPTCDYKLSEDERHFTFYYCTVCSYGFLEPNLDWDTAYVGPFQVELDKDSKLVAIPAEAKWVQPAHDFYEYTDRAPTCLEDGVTTDKLCKVCGYKEAGKVRPAEGHKWEVVAKVEPTCEKAGKVEGVKCTVCGQMAELTKADTFDYEDAKGNYIYVTEETRTEIKALGHKMEHVDRKAATCTEDGHEDGFLCANGCGKRDGAKVIKATGHNIEGVKWTVIKQPTTGIDGEGIRVKYCKVCNEVAAQELIPATQEGQLGDANMDGNVDLFDVVRIMNYVLGNTDEINEYGGDYNCDGDITINDAIRLMNAILG